MELLIMLVVPVLLLMIFMRLGAILKQLQDSHRMTRVIANSLVPKPPK